MVISRFISFNVENITLNGRFFIPAETGIYPAVCICHGIPSGQPPEPGDGGYPALAEQICQAGFAALIFNFRGSRDSGGNFDILGWTEDLAAAIDFLWEQPEIDRSRIALLGYSAGAAVAVCAGARDTNIAAVAACACPADFAALIKDPQLTVDHFRSIGIIRDKDFPESIEEWQENFQIVSPIYYADKISPRPLLLVHGDSDELVPVDNARRLHEKAGEPKQLSIIKGAGHQLRNNEHAVHVVIDWLNSLHKHT